jgi:hypothetical protein
MFNNLILFKMAKVTLTLFIIISVIYSGLLAQHSEVISQLNPEKINWPGEYEPSRSRFYVHNEIEVNAPPEVVWEILIQAESWPEWYEGASDVNITNSEDNRLHVE